MLCQPTLSDKPPSGSVWLHEIKHDGYRILARKEADRIRLWSRNGRDWSREFTAIAEAMKGLPDCIIDGEACAHCEEGWPDFWQLRGGGSAACFFAFDLLMLDGEDWRRRPLIERKARLKRLSAGGSAFFATSSTWKRVGLRCSPVPAACGLRALCRRGAMAVTGRGGARIGSRSRTRITSGGSAKPPLAAVRLLWLS